MKYIKGIIMVKFYTIWSKHVGHGNVCDQSTFAINVQCEWDRH